MKVYQTDEIRNVVLLGNSGSGKTILAETMLYAGGLINRRGEIAAKNTVSDYRDIEHVQQGSIFSTVLYAEWKGCKLNILDAPGLDDFIGGAVSSLRVTDCALLLLNAQNGIEVGTEIVWRHIANADKPVIFVVNHLDHEKTNFEKTIEEAKQYFGNKIALLQYPINAGPGFNCIVDVLKMKMYKWQEGNPVPQISDIPADEKSKAEDLQKALMEAAAECDESLMEVYFENDALSEAEILKGIRSGLKKRDIFPVVCTSARADFGVRELMDYIIELAPNPMEMPPAKTVDGIEVKCDSNGPTAVFSFKTSIEPHLGEISFYKVMSGNITESIDLINTTRQSKERIAQIYAVAGKTRTKVPQMNAGDIGASVKLREVEANHTLAVKEADWKFESIAFPESKMRTAIKSANEGDDEKLGDALYKMQDEDPTYHVEYSKELKQLLVSTQGEHHLKTLKWHLDNVFKIEAEFLVPRIPYRETITKKSVASYRHKKQSGGAGQFGEVHLMIEPYEEGAPDPSTVKMPDRVLNLSVRGKDEHVLPWGGKLVFYNCIVGGVIEARFLPAILKGIMEKMEEGPLTGSYARDIRVAVFDGKMHPVDSNEISFKLAGLNAFKEAFKTAGPKIMEPVYDMEVRVPTDRMGDVISDLQGRRAIILGMAHEGRYEIIQTRVPLAEVGKYSTTLSSLTNGRASFSLKFAEYAQVPTDLQDKLLKEYEEQHKDE